MERAYDVFVDNGLYILAYYLNKDVKDITYQDIEDSVDLMGDKVEEFLDCEKYSNLKSMFLFNSAVSNPSLKDVKLKTVLNEFAQGKGDSYCMLCGENHADINMKLKGRSYLPNRPSATYFNFSNNLHNINVCPYCLLLTTYSVMNCRVHETVYIFNSPDDEFMECYTIEMQEENIRDIIANAGKSKTNTSRVDILVDLVDKHDTFKSEIEIYRFTNGKDEKIPNADTLSSKNVQLIRKLDENNLLDEFRSLGMAWMLFNNRLGFRYLDTIYDFEKEEVNCSDRLFEFLNREVNMLDEKTISIIDRLTSKISAAKLNDKKLSQNLKGVNGVKSLERELMRLLDLYFDKTNEGLFTKEELNILTNPKNYISIRNMMLIDLVNK